MLTPAGQQAIEHARVVYLDALEQTLGAHLDKADLVDLATITDKLLTALAGPDPRCDHQEP